MKMQRIASSTGEIDRRHYNGNNGTRRGLDKKTRKRCGFYILKDEVCAGLSARLDALIEYYGSPSACAKALKVTNQTVNGWLDRGRISWQGAEAANRAYRRQGHTGYRAAWLRYDLKFDTNGKCIEKRCTNRKYMRVVMKDELDLSTNS